MAYQIDLEPDELKALDKYRRPLKWSRKAASEMLIRRGLIRSGSLKQKSRDKELGIGE